MRFEKFQEHPLDNEQMIDSGNSVKREYSLSNIQEIVDNNRYSFPKVASKFQLLEFIPPIVLNPFGNDDLELNEESLENKPFLNSSNFSINLKDNKDIDLINQNNREFEASHLNSKLYTREDGSLVIEPSINLNSNQKVLKGRSNSDPISLIKKVQKINTNIEYIENIDIQNKRIFKIEKNHFNEGLSSENNIFEEAKIQNPDRVIIKEFLSEKKNLKKEIPEKPRKYSMHNYILNELEHYQESKEKDNDKKMNININLNLNLKNYQASTSFQNQNNNQNQNNQISQSNQISKNNENNEIVQNSLPNINASLNANSTLIVDSSNGNEEKGKLNNISKISSEERKLKIQKYLAKKKKRNYNKRTRYRIRKLIAERRIRKNCKFICKKEEKELKKRLH